MAVESADIRDKALAYASLLGKTDAASMIEAAREFEAYITNGVSSSAQKPFGASQAAGESASSQLRSPAAD